MEKLSAAFNRAPDSVAKEIQMTIRTSVNFIRPFMRQKAPHRSGKLSRSIFAKVNGLEGSVGPDLSVTPYALYVHRGTGIYGPFGKRIYPTSKKALYWKGAAHPYRSVAGQKANPFVKNTFDEIKDPIERIWSEMIKRVISNFCK